MTNIIDVFIGLCLYMLIVLITIYTGLLLRPKRKVIIVKKYVNATRRENCVSKFYNGKNISEMLTFGEGLLGYNSKGSLINLKTRMTIPTDRWVAIRNDDKKIFILTDDQMSLFY